VDSTAITQSSTLGAGFWSFSGMGTATATIYNVEAQAYFRSAAGLIVDHPDAFHLDTWLAATDWAFESLTGYEGAKPASFIFSWSFLNGAEGASASVANLSGLQKRVLAVYDARFSVLDAMRARHDRVYGSAH
jgi:hypothetical protein